MSIPESEINRIIAGREKIMRIGRETHGGGVIDGVEHPLYVCLPPRFQQEILDGKNVLFDHSANYQIQPRSIGNEKQT